MSFSSMCVYDMFPYMLNILVCVLQALDYKVAFRGFGLLCEYIFVYITIPMFTWI